MAEVKATIGDGFGRLAAALADVMLRRVDAFARAGVADVTRGQRIKTGELRRNTVAIPAQAMGLKVVASIENRLPTRTTRAGKTYGRAALDHYGFTHYLSGKRIPGTDAWGEGARVLERRLPTLADEVAGDLRVYGLRRV